LLESNNTTNRPNTIGPLRNSNRLSEIVIGKEEEKINMASAHSICCDEARILEIENNSRYKKYSYTESARMVF
jgi:hypothetical protein